MNVLRITKWCLVAALLGLGASFDVAQARAAPPDPAAGEEGIEILTRGPIHEAFAETVTFDPQPGIVVPQAPPDAIEELPPDQKPEGDNVAWVPGYWAWDDERSDFLWVSGIWRALPPGRQWVSGYWGRSGRDYQWTSGYWADAEASEVEYLSEPPESVEVGPNIEAPSADHTWLPGCWVWREYRYAWRPGYWATVQPDWVWVPAHYVCSPRGYVFVDGYWDYSIARRGILFAPVYFTAGVYTQPGYFYSPVTVINPAVFAVHLFLRPQYGHYYFGDYYAANYNTAGFYPWFSFHNHHGYDPIYAHHRWEHRQDREWEQHVEAEFRHRRDHEDARPPHTWAAQREHARSETRSDETSFVVAAQLEVLARSSDSPLKFQRVDNEERQRLAERAQEVIRSRTERQQRENRPRATSADQSVRGSDPVRVKLPRSPIVARPADQLGEGQPPPSTEAVPDPDPKIEPRPRKPGRNPRPPQADPTVPGDQPPPGEQPSPDAPKPRKPGRNPKPPQADPTVPGDQPPAEEQPSPDVPKPRKPARNPKPPQADPTVPGDQSPPGEQPSPDEPKPRKPRRNPKPPQADPTVPGDQPPPVAPKPKSEAPKPEAPKPEAPKPEAPKPEAPKPEAPKPEAPKPEAPKPEAPKPEAPKPEAPKPEAPKPEAPKPEAPKPEAPKPEAPQPEAQG